MGNNILDILFTSSIGFLVLFVISKLLGKKQMGELDFIDYVVGISIGSIAAEMAVNAENVPFYHYVIAMVVFFLLTFLIDILSLKNNFFKRLFIGSPLVIIKDGKIDYRALKKSKLSINDLVSLARVKNYFNLDDIAYAVFETNGTLSVLPKSNQKPLVTEDLKIETNKTTLPHNIIVDGEVSFVSLDAIGKDTTWLFERLNIKDKKELKNILLAIYNEDDNTFIVHYKA
ncbi:MAG: DUF421 domain-containing protein [Clostridia bacterium]|nr:DUF421 domain-containing protein [Clostridia bacterium]